MKTKARTHCRWMIRRDMPEVMEIEQHGYGTPWTEDELNQCLRQRNCIGIVAEDGDRVVGFAVYELHDGRIKLLNFAVHPNCRRQRVGSDIARYLTGKLVGRRRCLSLYMRESNLAAQLFFRSVGFKATHVLRGYFKDTGEAAYKMEFSREGGE